MKNIKSIYRFIEAKVLHSINKVGRKKRNEQLKNKDFTIISNNCFGGVVYEYLNLPYKTPTIGLYFFAPDYIKFIYDLKHYLKENLVEIDARESKYYKQLKEAGHSSKVIARLGDIEIIFLHFKSFKDAKQKWDKRKKRINFDRIIFKFNDQNGCSEEELMAFHNFSAKNKICFTAKKYKYEEFYQLKRYANEECVLDDVYRYHSALNIIDYINSLK